ncbi:GGDEF domain-containing phosphodiesterase, partial [Myxococcota bacterium]|nr:GGDEF domain-containing phosphodiesterase [Myxococcota bacterium]
IDGYVLRPLNVDQFMRVLFQVLKVLRLSEENSMIKAQVAKITTGEFLDIEKRLMEMNSEYFYNPITSLPNRSALLRDVGTGQNEKTLFLVDIRRFKRINELYGIKAGDMVLQRFGGYLREFSEDYNCRIYHISADEFALLFDEPGTLEECHQRAQVLVFYTYNRKCVIAIDQRRIEISTMSNTGVAFREPDPLQMANIALNHAMKENLPYSIYSQSFKEDLEHDETYTRILKEALAKDTVVPYFQPIISTSGEKKYEVLMRILTPERVLTPYFFLEIAKKTGDYTTLTKIIIEKSFKIFEHNDATFSINLSYQDATNHALAEYLKEQIEKYGVAKRLILEIVESESIDNFSTILNFLGPFREMGVRIAIDDFGSGYSNFSYLLQINPEYIKIDGSIIRNIDHDEKSLLIAQTITRFAQSLGIQTIAEFIHSEEVYKMAQRIGVDWFQGFHLGTPEAELL